MKEDLMLQIEYILFLETLVKIDHKQGEVPLGIKEKNVRFRMKRRKIRLASRPTAIITTVACMWLINAYEVLGRKYDLSVLYTVKQLFKYSMTENK